MNLTHPFPTGTSRSSAFALSIALISLPAATQAATIVTNNTGLPSSSIEIIDNGDPGYTNNISGGTNGTDGPANAYGTGGVWGNTGDTIYLFSGIADGLYNIYGTWHSNGDTSANGYTVNGNSLGIFSITNQPDSSAAFTAYNETVETDTDFEPFQLLGQVTVSGTGSIEVVITPEGANGFGRFDAVGIAPVPEPSSMILSALAGLGIMLRRRR